MDSILHAASNVAEDFPGGITGMAAAIGKNKFSLAHELSATGGAKLGVVDVVKMTNRAHDYRIVTAINEACGGMPFMPLPDALLVEGNDTMRNLSHLAKEFGDVVQEVSLSVSDGHISANEMARMDRQWAELVAAGQRMMMHLRAAHEATQATRPNLKAA